ncbi:uncharacterized protein LOC116348812 isoform X2 [Contarinia nasturtii]|uniref:uncharacterized protein LOC116348812 isoform X2 n=1 Tax=Contarinia nasturtii TaxID=265458 RepID=UPI0012D401DE|nr:uncharacterized protein LOC116348812 isoform X2 [Contarinia nasturtii]
MDNDVDMEMNNVRDEDVLLDHIILPRVLPQTKPRYLYDTEIDLMKKMVKNVEKMSEFIPRKTVEMFQRLQRVHMMLTKENISKEINELCPGDTFAMFVRFQHTGFMIHVPSTEAINNVQNVIVSTIPNLHPDQVYKHDTDFEFNYPEQAIKMHFSKILRSEEFANQLCVLFEGLPVEGKNRDCVCKWLVTLLDDGNSTSATKYPFITKKIRDEILGESKTNYFRRSSFYISVKVMLQHNLTLQLGSENGKLLYKIVMLNFLTSICGLYKEYDTFNIDLLSQLIAKLARRIEKLLHMVSDETPKDVINLLKSVVKEAKENIELIRQKIDSQIKNLQNKIENEAKSPSVADLNFEADIIYKIPKLTEYLTKRMKKEKLSDNKTEYTPKTYERYFTKDLSNIESINTTKHGMAERIFWSEFEQVVLYEMKMDDDRWSDYELRTWSFAYAKYAKKNFKGNPLFMSQMLLVRLKLIAVMDKLATKKHPLLLQHHSGINQNIINELLIPQHINMCIAHEIEKYFQKRNSQSNGPSLIGEKNISDKSFSVKYAKEHSDMLEIQTKILKQDEKNVDEKKKELQRRRDEKESYKSKANRRNCECYIEYGYKQHFRDCTKCAYNKMADQLRVKQYEHLLPTEEIQRLAVVFELQIPSEIAHLRDVLNKFAKFCLGDSKFESENSQKIKGKWTDRLSEFSNKSNHIVTLGSTQSEKLEEFRVSSNSDWFFIKSTFNCVFHAKKEQIINSIPDDAIKSVCIFKAQNEYDCLQWTLVSTNHTQNQVLSEQSHCRQELTLSEYKNFGSLRADGHRLQLRKLYAMIETESLSFENESVLALIMQTLWECGVSGNDGSTRESHIDFRDPKFCSAMIELLLKFVSQQRNNWRHPFKLLIVTLIAVRAYEINCHDEMVIEIISLLRQIRVIALDWIRQIEDSIRSMANPNEKTEQELRMKLIHVAISGGLTFFINPKHKNYEKIFEADTENDLTAIRAWFQFNITLKNGVRMYTTDESKLPPNVCMFLRLMECVGLCLEPKITELITQNPNEVYKLIKMLWSRADSDNTTFQPINFYKKYPHLLVIEVIIQSRRQFVTIDIITGSFSVDGFPLSRLPEHILNSGIYQWFFGQVVFEVIPDGDNFSTVHKFNNCIYEFKLIDNKVIITERNKVNDFEKELIDQSILNGEFPPHLVENYSHWWNKKENCIEFRRKAMDKTHFSKVTDVDYRFDYTTSYLCHVQTQRIMLDIKSDSFQKIIDRLSRLEHHKYILILQESAHAATVELLRMNLKFNIDLKTYDLISNEISGMRISLSQNVGTLYGLHHGLILESISNAKTKTILIPNGEIGSVCTDLHISVHVKTEQNLNSPPFYQYQVDEFCCQLKASNGSYASWFYLAYLHAITSHGEIEPFTEMSGTERALQILQSAYAWSSEPYEPEARKMLKKIANLTPLRNLRKGKQLVNWPENIPPRSAQDCFFFIVQKLLSNSQRLYSLYSKDPPKPLKLETLIKLNVRDHWRCHPLNPNLRVHETFIPQIVLKTVLPNTPPISFCKDTRHICLLYHKNRYYVPGSLNLTHFLTVKRETLVGLTNSERLKDLLYHSVHDKFADLWISLYEAARKQELNREEFAIIFSFFAHHGEEINPIFVLQAIAANPKEFEHIHPPKIESFPISAGTFKVETISNILKDNHKQPDEYYSKDWEESGKRQKYDDDLKNVIKDIEKIAKDNWPCASFVLGNTFLNRFEYIDYATANDKINKKLRVWYKNYQLDVFIQTVEMNLKSLPECGLGSCASSINRNRPSIENNFVKFQIDYEAKIRDCFNALSREKINEAHDTWQMKAKKSIYSAHDWWTLICNKISQSNETHHLIKAGIFPRMVPSMYLPKIIDTTTDERLKCLIGAWAMEIAREQRQKRIEIFKQRPELQAILSRELKDEPHSNWQPSEYPEWLLFEIEQNLMIRRIQIEIARRMITPPESNTKHSVMQLNMGEGKTVLKSLFATNLKSLRQYLGGFLNQKIYIFPCRRNMPIHTHIDSILSIYEECLKNKGVILTLPEYRLSFQLKIYEMIQNEEMRAAKSLLQVHKWMNANIRNVLDESDAILQAKYQLIYTVGAPRESDGGSLRWLVTQAVLKRVPDHMHRLYGEYGNKKIEFDENYVKSGNVVGWPNVDYRSDVFTPCRILDDIVFDALKMAIIDDFLKGELDIDFNEISTSKKEKLRHLLTEKAIEKLTFYDIMRKFSEIELNTILILSGLLRFEVLKLTLTKRWRVHYGVNVKSNRKMAIPFKAKDVAAEMTEFGHPDVAVCFTQMSYYYSGLTDDQLRCVFSHLENAPDAAATYEKWIRSIDGKLIEPSIRTYSGVNLDNPHQRDEYLFPLLRYNMYVIDFWLSNLVFSQELKMFDKKLMCTSWELTSDHYAHRVTGFSGTNDTKNILPIMIGQNDLKELEGTNEKMRNILKDARNGPYQNLPANVSGKQILDALVEHDIPVLLDSGALMLELNNKEVASEWLKRASKEKYDAAVYFDGKDTLQTIERSGMVTEFDYSVYKENLAKCLVYLDDEHTRGTDLRFPVNWKACVTLSGDITRDKSVQSCMRMRQLETSQSIRFWASYEADIRIRKVCELSERDTVENVHVIKFIEHNSRQFEKANMMHWTTGALNYTKKLVGHKQYENAEDDDSMKKLYEKCVDDDFAKLVEMYGEKEEAKIIDIAWKKFDKIDGRHVDRQFRSFIREMKDNVVDKLNELATDVKRFTHALDEEQEKELEQEVEEQTQIERPPGAKPATPKFNEQLKQLVINGATDGLVNKMKIENSLLSIVNSLANTQLSEFCEKNADAWSKYIFVTNDFCTVLQGSSQLCDAFLRPTWWLAQIKGETKNIIILLSSFECNHLLPAFRHTTNATLFMYRPRLSKLHSNLIHEEKLQITGNLTANTIDIEDEVQIGVFSGMMYFKNEMEQNAYCSFLGLIPRPRTAEQEKAFEDKIIKENGYVPPKKRKMDEISNCVDRCRFEHNPRDFVIKLINAHHQGMPKVTHVSSILVRCKKVFPDDNAMQVD